MSATATVLAPRLLVTTIIEVYIILAWRRINTVRLRVGFLAVGYVRWRAQGSGPVNASFQNSVSSLDLLLLNRLSLLHEPFPHLSLIKRVLLDLVVDKLSYRYCERGDINQFCHKGVNARGLWYILVYRLFH